MKRDNRLFILSILFVIACSALSVWRTHEIKQRILPGGPTVDMKVVAEQVKSGNLSIHEAEYYKVIEE